MKEIRIDASWKKVNLVTLHSGKNSYDLYKHTSGVTGKRWGIKEWLILTEKNFKKYSLWTNNRNKTLKGRTVRITRCDACGNQFKNLIPGSKHTVIPPPESKTEDDRGVWVIGVGEPVKILNNEFKYVNEESEEAE